MNTESKIGLRHKVVSQHERTYKRGTLMFIEGETGTEMYIIRAGKVRVLKQEGENTIELAVLGPGSVLGELALLDHQPRGATAQVVEDVTATVIDEDLFAQTLGMIPSWLSNIVNVVVKRLRDTMKRTGDDVVRKNIGGVVKILLLLYDSGDNWTVDGKKVIPLNRVKEAVYTTTGLGSIEAENALMHLILRGMVLIKRNDLGQEYIVLKDCMVLQAYVNYLRALQRGGPIPGEKLSETGLRMIEVILDAGDKSGRLMQPGVVSLGVGQIDVELKRRDIELQAGADALDELIACKAVAVDGGKTGRFGFSSILFNKDAMRRLQLFRLWLPTFQEDVQL